MSLESGVILCRLNQELLPDPGRPIARTTTPLGARGMVAGGAAAAAVLAALGTSGAIIAEALRCGEGGAGGSPRRADSRGWVSPRTRPRPPLPRRRRRRPGASP